VTDLRRWANMVIWQKVGAEPKSNNGSGAQRQGGLIMRILRRMLMILVMVVLRMRP